MNTRFLTKRSIVRWLASVVLAATCSLSLVDPGALARRTHHTAAQSSAKGSSSATRSSRTSSRSARGRRGTAVASAHRGRHHRKSDGNEPAVAHAPKTRYAYPISIFIMHPPEFEHDPLPGETSQLMARAFQEGRADEYSTRSLVRAGVVTYHPLRGGLFWRREPVKYVIVHSTETGIPMGAPRVIDSWSSSGRRHAGAQFVVDRDGTIYLAVDPDLATVHVNIFKTLPGINNDNSIGIEMCHTGKQNYTPEQRESVIMLVTYLQERYKVQDENVITHRYAQRGDHTDPVNFDWEGFLADKDHFRTRSIALKMNKMREDAHAWETATMPAPAEPPAASTYLEPHRLLPTPKIKVDTSTNTAAHRPGYAVPSAASGANPANSASPANETTANGANGSNGSNGASGSNGFDLRGPIEMDPADVQKLNTHQSNGGAGGSDQSESGAAPALAPAPNSNSSDEPSSAVPPTPDIAKPKRGAPSIQPLPSDHGKQGNDVPSSSGAKQGNDDTTQFFMP